MIRKKILKKMKDSELSALKALLCTGSESVNNEEHGKLKTKINKEIACRVRANPASVVLPKGLLCKKIEIPIDKASQKAAMLSFLKPFPIRPINFKEGK